MSDEAETPGEHPSPVPPIAPDNRQLWEWKTKYEDAAPQIRCEAKILGLYLFAFGLTSVLAFSYAGDFTILKGDPAVPLFHLERRDVLCWLVGSVGGTVFAIKWLVHSVANGIWHQDRFLWRVFVPLTGGIYAHVVLAIMQSGIMAGKSGDLGSPNLMREIVIAFLAGYFADGVSGLLTNVANAIFGKVDKK